MLVVFIVVFKWTRINGKSKRRDKSFLHLTPVILTVIVIGSTITILRTTSLISYIAEVGDSPSIAWQISSEDFPTNKLLAETIKKHYKTPVDSNYYDRIVVSAVLKESFSIREFITQLVQLDPQELYNITIDTEECTEILIVSGKVTQTKSNNSIITKINDTSFLGGYFEKHKLTNVYRAEVIVDTKSMNQDSYTNYEVINCYY